nr:unnamed protein product [Callosobruchus analis]
METSLNDGVYDSRGNTVQNVPHQPLLMDTNEMYTNNVMQYQTTDPSNSVYDMKETMMKTTETELTQTTQQYYYSQTDQQNNQSGYADYVLQQQTETTYIQQQTISSEFPQEQFLQISNIQNEQVVSERPEEASMQYAEAPESSFGSQYEAEKTQDVASETAQVDSKPMPPEHDTVQEETMEANATLEETAMESNVPVVENVVEEACHQEQAVEPTEQGTEEPSTGESHQSAEPSEEKEEPLSVEPQTNCTEHAILEGSEEPALENGVGSNFCTKEKQEPEESQPDIKENIDLADKDVVAVENVTEEAVVQQEAQQFAEPVGVGEEVIDDPAAIETPGDPLQVQETTEQETEDVLQQEDSFSYMSEIREEANSRLSVTSSASTQGSRRSSRRPYQDIPLHVVGHNLTKPGENQLNGKPIPKPRLGVKVPYWNLSSQMLTKAEIEKEILERSKTKQDQASSVSFARSLTQRLFKKIADSDEPKGGAEDNVTKTDKGHNEKSTVDVASENTKIKNDSDLLAILEGDDSDMPVMTKKTTPSPQVDEASIKALEREIALQQLEELPLQKESRRAPKRSRATTSTPQTPSKMNAVSAPSNVLEAKSSSGKENSISPTKKSPLNTEVSPRKETVIDVEPQVRANMVLKTYSRKRKVDESADGNIKQEPKTPAVEDPQVKKEDVATPTQGVYVTKSSRVIKKKIIWDPDEVSSRSPKPSKAPETVPPVIPKSVTEKSAEKKPSPDKQTKKVVIVKKDKPDTKPATTDKKPATAEKKSVTHDKKPATTEKKNVVAEKKAVTKGSSPKVKPKKLMTELDRLLMDEGAVKMLYELKSNDEGTPSPPKKQKDFVSIEKAQKEIMKKASQIKNDLVVGGEGAKTLRKKEGPPSVTVSPVKAGPTLERKMSKDSVRSLVHTPPPSPFMHSHSSMLIRRRSSSSISSSDDLDSDAPRSNKRSRKSKRNTEEFKVMEKDPLALDDKNEIDSKSIHGRKLLAVKKINKQVSVELTYPDSKCLLTEEMLDELTTTVKKYSKDKDCSVLCITSTSKAFCLGLDYSSLVVSDDKERKNKAANLADKVRDFLLSLLHFPKVLVAGIQGECSGLAVIMLPLFDTVIANDNASFSAPYVKLGCVPEAGFLLEQWGLSGRRLAADLLYTGDKITADDACKRGLVSKLCWPEKYNETLKNVLAAIAKGSRQSLLSTKRQLQSHMVKQTEAALEKEIKTCADLWISTECQKNFAEVSCNG